MTSLWRIYCLEPGDEGWHSAWANSAISTCPVNAAHAVNADSVQQIDTERQTAMFSDLTVDVTQSIFRRVVSVTYDTDINGPVRRVRAVAVVTGDTTSFDLELFDVTNTVARMQETFSNAIEGASVFGELSTPTSGSAVLEVNAKINNGTGSVYITEIAFLASKN